MLPGIRPKSVTVPHDSATLSAPLFNSAPKMDNLARQQEIDLIRGWQKNNLMTLPFREAGYWTWKGLKTVKKTWNQEAFIYMRVKGKNGTWKLDSDPAWALDEGRALDRLVKHESMAQ